MLVRRVKGKYWNLYEETLKYTHETVDENNSGEYWKLLLALPVVYQVW